MGNSYMRAKSRILIVTIYFAIMAAFSSALTWFIYQHNASFFEWALLMAGMFIAAVGIEAIEKRQRE
jgi:hypothetical protein